MITRAQAQRIKSRLLTLLDEDAHNTQRLLARLDSISRESGIGAHAALLLILSHQAFEEQEARNHWEAILEHRDRLAEALGRPVGIRVALLDHFVNANRQLTQPTLIDLEMFEVTERTSGIDPVTGLHSERAFRAAVQHELRRARRYGQNVSVVLFDLDDFEHAMERGGELMGDRLLREVGILMKNKSRDIDVAARPGGDELALVLPETDRNGALLVAERFRLEVEAYFARRETGAGVVGLTVSGGVASYPEDAGTPELLLEHAAQALYRAKAAGKNAVHVYHPERRRFLRFELEPGRFEVEVLAPRKAGAVAPRDLSRNGILFTCPEALEVGEEIEIRFQEPVREGSTPGLRIRGRVVRLEELPPGDRPPEADADGPAVPDRYEIGVAFDVPRPENGDELLDFLERAHGGKARGQP